MGALAKALRPQSSHAAKKTDLWPDLMERLSCCMFGTDVDAFEAHVSLIEMEIPGGWREPIEEAAQKRREEIQQEDVSAIMRDRFDF